MRDKSDKCHYFLFLYTPKVCDSLSLSATYVQLTNKRKETDIIKYPPLFSFFDYAFLFSSDFTLYAFSSGLSSMRFHSLSSISTGSSSHDASSAIIKVSLMLSVPLGVSVVLGISPHAISVCICASASGI